MIYLFFQTWIWILLAGVLGLLIGWLIWGREEKQSSGMAPGSESSSGEETVRHGPGGEQGNPDQSTVAQPVDGHQTPNPLPNGSRDPDQPLIEPVLPRQDEVGPAPVRNSWKPEFLAAPEGAPDNLQRIKGVGPVIEKTLNNLGVYHFHQIAGFTEENIKWMNNYISFPGRIQREQWVAQAINLAANKDP